MTHRTRPQYIQDMVNRANEIFKANGTKDPHSSDLFMMMDRLLLDKNMYEGYNMYKWEGVDEYGLGGRLVLAGTADPNKFDCIQLY